MNPGRRRLLIPGLLVVLLIIVAAVGYARRADAETKPVPVAPSTQVSVISDPRVTESSGLAASTAHPGLAYTINDSGDSPRVFAVDIASGKVVGETDVDGVTWRDTEAMALWGGMVWVADLGTNGRTRTDQAVYVFPEPGEGNHHVRARRFPVTFAAKHVEIESMAILPRRIDFYSKGWPGGVAYTVAAPLKRDAQNIAYRTPRKAPAWTTDATASRDGRLVLVRGVVVVEVRDAKTWKLRYSDAIPMLKQGETITLEASGKSYLIGSEGKDSPLVRIPFHPDRVDRSGQKLDSSEQFEAQHPVSSAIWEHQWTLVRAAIFSLAGLVAVVFAWRRLRRRRKESVDGN
jgi:hypothetical protein